MIGNETRILPKFVDLSSKAINTCENWHMLRRDIATSSLKGLCENLNPVKSYGKTNIIVLYSVYGDKYRWGLTSFGRFMYIIYRW